MWLVAGFAYTTITRGTFMTPAGLNVGLFGSIQLS